MSSPLLEAEQLAKTFDAGRRRAPVHALDGVSLQVEAGTTIALVGESGSGKTTLGRTILGLSPPTSGSVRIWGRDVYSGDRDERAAARKAVQVVFQNPSSSLDPTMKVSQIVCEPIREPRRLRGAEMRERAAELLDAVQLNRDYLQRRPFELSGGEQQRVAIARAVAADPDLVVLDEPTSSIDFAVRRQILDLLHELQTSRGLTFFFITHDLVSAQYLAATTAVLYAGRTVEVGPTPEVLTKPRHPYTKVLIESALSTRPGVKPSLARPDLIRAAEHNWSGCAFRQRCPLAASRCSEVTPELRALAEAHRARCHFAELVRPTELADVG
jgi:oligopeptide/dipeptide ABC transporter ATP-binding protein